MVALWNNFHAMAAKNNQAIPEEPLWFLKSPSAFLPTGETIRRPAGQGGPVVCERELGIVIGRRCKGGHVGQTGAAAMFCQGGVSCHYCAVARAAWSSVGRLGTPYETEERTVEDCLQLP